MKRFLFSVVTLALTTSMIAASGGGSKGGSGSGSGSGSSSSSGSGSGGSKSTSGSGGGSGSSSSTGSGGTIKSLDAGNKLHVLDKHVDVSKTINTGQVLNTKINKLDIVGNKNVAKLPGFKSDPKLHTQLMSKYKVPSKLFDFCFFHHDFCYSSYCWLPGFGCCGYWHPYSRCWYYWYEPYCCYLPYTYIEVYRPVVVTEVAAAPTSVNVNVNNNNTNTNDNIEPQGPTGLPPGASATLPAGVNPIIPAPKQ